MEISNFLDEWDGVVVFCKETNVDSSFMTDINIHESGITHSLFVSMFLQFFSSFEFGNKIFYIYFWIFNPITIARTDMVESHYK